MVVIVCRAGYFVHCLQCRLFDKGHFCDTLSNTRLIDVLFVAFHDDVVMYLEKRAIRVLEVVVPRIVER